MKYLVKNITNKVFSFEGVVIAAGEVSGELTLDMYQRLLALNFGTALMPVEEGEVAPEEVPVEEAIEEESPEPTPVQEAEVEVMKEDVNVAETVVEAAAPAVADEPQVEVRKQRGRPRKNQ